MNRTAACWWLLSPLLLVSACSRQDDEAAVDPAAGAADQIAWFAGSVEQAFAAAAREGKPIFLYWGAEWCPPCHEIKATVFRSRAFIERSRLFVAVYLDGDAENAQALGERFGVVGYPTMVVFSPAGEEITRIPGGIDIQAYANVLDLTLGDAQPVSALLGSVLDDGARLDAADCRLLAYYSWDQSATILEGRDRAAAFRRLSGGCPPDAVVEASALYLRYLDAAVKAAAAKDNPVPLGEADKREAVAKLHEILGDAGRARASLYTVLMSGAEFTAALTAPGSAERTALRAAFLAALDGIENDSSVFTTERLYTAIGRIRLERIDDGTATISEALRERILESVARADAATADGYERQTVINAAGNVLEEAGLHDQARELLLAELTKSKQPYYFMVGLAEIEQQAGNHAAALDWLERGYTTAKGPATRFQWGSYWVTGLIEMTPDDVDGIAAGTIRIVAELESARAFYQRPKAQLRRLEAALTAWATTEQRQAGLERIREGVRGICAAIGTDVTARATCEGFLATA